MRVGIVAEGPSDFRVLGAILQAIDPGVELERIWPDTAQGGRAYGWRGVQSWCQDHRDRLEVLMRGVSGRELDVLVVHLDCSMAGKVGAARPCPPGKATADVLRSVALGWMNRAPTPCWLVLATPAQNTGAWIVAALTPRYEPSLGIECDPGIEEELVRRKRLRRKSGEIKKPDRVAAELAALVASSLAVVRRRCGEADRFCIESIAAMGCVSAECWMPT